MKITVYLGANSGNDSKYENITRELGKWIGENSHTLIYGGSKSGLMGVLSNSVLDAGGHVTGVEHRMFIDRQIQNERVEDLIVADNFPERKTMMYKLGDAFIAVPGGVGTLDEISEVIALSSLGELKGPCIFLNLDGYYNPLKMQLDVMDEAGFLKNKDMSNIFFADTVSEIEKICSGFAK